MELNKFIILLTLILVTGCSKESSISLELENQPISDGIDHTAGGNDNNDPTTLNIKDGFKAVLVQPLVITNNSGKASFYSIDLKKINNAYSRAKVQFVWLMPKTVQNNSIYDGVMEMGDMQKWLADNDYLEGKNNIVNLVYTENLLRSSGPIGRGLIPGDITFIAFEPDPESILNVFVVCHEIGHNFGLLHADQDPNVPNDLPNVMGIGDYEDRLNPMNSFNDYQIEIISQASILHSEESALDLIKTNKLEVDKSQ